MEDPIKAHDEYVTKVMNDKLMEGKAGTMYIPEIFDAISRMTKVEDKIKTLHANNKPALQIIFRLTIDPDIKFNFSLKELKGQDLQPMDIPDFDTAPTTLLSEAKRLVNLTNKKKGVQLSKEKSLKIAREMLSAMHENDREVVYQMVSGKFKFKGLTERLILQAFPNLIPLKPEQPQPLPFENDDDDKETKTESGSKVSKSDGDSGDDSKSKPTKSKTVSEKSGVTGTEVDNTFENLSK